MEILFKGTVCIKGTVCTKETVCIKGTVWRSVLKGQYGDLY